jgi:hypothetical protein
MPLTGEDPWTLNCMFPLGLFFASYQAGGAGKDAKNLKFYERSQQVVENKGSFF